MKKIYAVVLALALLSGSILAAAAATVNAERDQVKITENILYGDQSAAEGLEITTTNHMGYKLYWETDYTIGASSSPHTDFSFYAASYYGDERKHNYEGIYFNGGIEYVFQEKVPASQQEGISRAYKELFDATENGEERSEIIYLKDYYDTYPLGIGFDLPNTTWYRYDGENLKGKPYDALYVTEKFREYFKIPVLESDSVTISVAKDEDGNCYSTGTDEMGSYQMYTIGTVARSKNRCFFAINNYKYVDDTNNTDAVEYVDTSLIPGGYGIYSFYYCGGDSAGNTGILADKIETVYSLDEKTVVNHITLNRDETKLLLFTAENQSSYLTVIDVATMTDLQKIPLDGRSMNGVYEYDDFIVADLEDSICVISAAGDGYSLDFHVDKPSFIEENYRDLWNVDCMDYKNGKLAMIENRFEAETGYELCDFAVSVYDQSGLIFYGIYDNSLDLDRQNDSFGSECRPADNNPNKIKWK